VDNFGSDVQQWIFKMDVYLSPAHRRMIKDEHRKQIVAEMLPQLGLTEEMYNEFKSLPHFLAILGVAIESEIPFFSAEIQYFTDREAHVTSHNSQQEFFVEFHHNNFSEERRLYRSMFK
jgi:hypothetical protein